MRESFSKISVDILVLDRCDLNGYPMKNLTRVIFKYTVCYVSIQTNLSRS